MTRPLRETIRLGALILVSILVGAGGVVATAEVQEARAQEVLLRRVGIELTLAELQLEIVRSSLEEVEERVRLGLVDERALATTRARVREAEIHLMMLRLDREEVGATGREPSNDPSAPLVGGRDFVSERLELEHSLVLGGVRLAESRFARLEDLGGLGVASSEDREQAAIALEEARAQLQEVADRLAARRAFVAGDISADDVKLQTQLAVARQSVILQEQQVIALQTRVARLEELVAVGAVREEDLRRAQLELAERQLLLDLARVEGVLLRAGGAGGR